jgi:hypothetical protein
MARTRMPVSPTKLATAKMKHLTRQKAALFKQRDRLDRKIEVVTRRGLKLMQKLTAKMAK